LGDNIKIDIEISQKDIDCVDMAWDRVKVNVALEQSMKAQG
jgi:hypothetical protein